MRLVKTLLLLVFLFPILAIAQQGDSGRYSRPGAYVEGNVGANAIAITIFDESESSFDGLGLNVNLGYKFNPYVAAEGGYTHYFVSTGLNAAHLAIKGILPLGEQQRFKLFAKIGPGLMFKSGDSLGVLYGGFGAGYSLTPNLDLNAQFQGETFGWGGFGLFSIGLAYNF